MLDTTRSVSLRDLITRSVSLLAALAFVLGATVANAQAPKVAVDREATLSVKANTTTNTDMMDQQKLVESEGKPPATNPGIGEKLVDPNTTFTVAKWDGGSLTNQDVMAILKLRKPREFAALNLADLPRQSNDNLRRIVESLAFELLLFDKAVKDGITTDSDTIAPRLKRYRSAALNRAYYENALLTDFKKLEEAEKRKAYERDKNVLYTRPAKLLVKELFITFYQPYIAKKGDTLEDVVKRINGDPKQVERVLRGGEFPLLRMPPKAVRDKVPFLDLRPGERILVPMNKDEETSRVKLANRARERFEKGEDFGRLANEYGTHPFRGRDKAFNPDLEGIIPRLKTAIEKTTSGSVTEAVKTPNGVHVFYIEERSTTTTRPFEEVTDQIQLSSEALDGVLRQMRSNVFDTLAKKHGLTLNTAALERPDFQGADPLTASTVIASAPGLNYTLEQFQRDMLPTLKSWTGMTKDERFELARSNGTVTSFLLEQEAQSRGLDKTPAYLTEINSRAVIEVVSAYLVKRESQRKEPTEGDLREFYSKNLDKYTSQSMVTVREITRRLAATPDAEERKRSIENARTYLQGVRQRALAGEDFAELARRESQNISTRSRGGLVGTVPTSYRGDSIAAQLAKLKKGEISEPIISGSEAILIKLDDSIPAAPQPFEMVLPQVKTLFAREGYIAREKAFRESILKERNYKSEF